MWLSQAMGGKPIQSRYINWHFQLSIKECIYEKLLFLSLHSKHSISTPFVMIANKNKVCLALQCLHVKCIKAYIRLIYLSTLLLYFILCILEHSANIYIILCIPACQYLYRHILTQLYIDKYVYIHIYICLAFINCNMYVRLYRLKKLSIGIKFILSDFFSFIR